MDYAFRLKDIEWTPGETNSIVATLPEDIQEYIINELQMCKVDFLYWCNRYAYIVDDKGRNLPLIPWPSQLKLLKLISEIEESAWDYYQGNLNYAELQAKIAVIILKSRQVGGTVISEALLAHCAIFFGHTRAVIASDHPDNSLKLFRVLINIVDNLPGWMKPVEDARVKANNLHFSELDSDVVTGAGNQKTTLGQGMTVDAVHLTEVSTWDPNNALAIDADLKPAFNSSRKHHSLFLIESTGAGGKGNWYHDQYQAARSGKAMFKHIFMSWFMCPDKFIARTDGVTISPEVEQVLRRVKAETGIECNKEQAAWYQITRDDYKSSGKLQMFLQEYPSSADEAFQMGLKSAFSLDVRASVRDKCRLPIAVYNYNLTDKRFEKLDRDSWLMDDSTEKVENTLIIWEKNRAGFTYIVGGDASHGLDGGDSSALEVVRVGNKWEPDEQVAEWHGNLNPSDLSIPAWLMGHMYTDKIDGRPAKMAIESNPGSPGNVCTTDLMRRGYPNFYIYKRPLRTQGTGWSNEIGWWTTNATRPMLTHGGVAAIAKGDLLVNSPYVVEEMGSFVKTVSDRGVFKLEHADGYHDDRLMALFIAYYVAHEFDTRSIADDRRRAYEQRFQEPGQVIQLQQISASSWEDAVAKWEDSLELFE